MATLANIYLSLPRQFPWINDGIISLCIDIDDIPFFHFLNVQLARTVATFTIDAMRQLIVLVFRSFNQLRHGIVATHALQPNFTVKARVIAIFETWRTPEDVRATKTWTQPATATWGQPASGSRPDGVCQLGFIPREDVRADCLRSVTESCSRVEKADLELNHGLVRESLPAGNVGYLAV